MPRRVLTRGYYALRYEVLERDQFTCQYCGQQAPNVKLEVDHVLPVEDGGPDTLDNLKTSCWACNHGKGGLFVRRKRMGARLPAKDYTPYVSQPKSKTRVYELVEVLKEKPGLLEDEIALKLNLQRSYIHMLLHRGRSQGLIRREKIIGKRSGSWFVTD